MPRQTGCCHEPPTPHAAVTTAAAANDDTEAVRAGLRRHRNGAGAADFVLD